MNKIHARTFFCSLLLLCAAACILQPVLAETGTITIAYRGSGGSYIGDTVVFDGRNTFGNTTLLKLTGPGLPAEGVPANNLNGPAGTGTPVEVDQYGAWKFAWYSSIVPGIEKLKTGKYVFTATDSRNPSQTATAVFSLRKAQYSITAQPNPVGYGHYVELIGNAERDMTFAEIAIKDANGVVVHSFTSPVSSSGYFSYGFHVDMEPGRYPVTVSNPALKVPFGTVLTVIPDEGTNISTPSPTITPVQVTTAEQTPVSTTSPAAAAIPTRSPAGPATALAAIAAGIVAAGVLRR